MKKLSEFFKNLLGKWKGISKRKKIVFIILAVAILVALTVLIMMKTKTQYAVLYSKLDSNDAATVIQKLDDEKVSHTEDSTTGTIYVPKSKVDELRLKLASNVTGGSKGFELFDDSNSKFGTTDAEFNVEYQRALQGELEKNIKSLDSVEDARVNLVMPQDSVFVKDSTAATASVTLKLKPGESLTKDQVLAIISLVSGSVRNLPKENIQVIDDKMNLLSKDVLTDQNDSSATAETRDKAETQVEDQLEKKALDALEGVYGKGKVKVKINADLNFDSQETNAETYYNNPTDQKDTKNPVIVSQHSTNSSSTGTTSTSGSPTDNNNSNSNTITNNGQNSNSTSSDVTTNYDVSNEKTKTVKSPGDVRRLTISVLVDGNIDANTQNTLSNIVGNAVGFDTKRGDSISVEGMPFDQTAEKNAQKALDDMKKAEQAAANQKLYIGLGIAGAVLLVLLALLGRRIIKKRREARALRDELENTQNLDVLVDDDGIVKEKPIFEPIDFESENEDTHMEKEIKKYASTKPEQVVDIVKAWLTNEER